MARRPRIEYPGAIYHVMARGNARNSIFLEDADREVFLDTFDEVCARCEWEVYAFVLMTNHYHFAFRTPKANLVEGMTWFQNTYTRRFNSRHRGWGRLFGDRYKAELVQGDGSWDEARAFCPGYDRKPPRNRKLEYIRILIDYIHLNPARARIVDVTASGSTSESIDFDRGLGSYQWSSLTRGYLVSPGKRPDWLVVKRGLKHLGYPDRAEKRRAYLSDLENRIRKEWHSNEGNRQIETGIVDQAEHERALSVLEEKARGWVWGDPEFVELAREAFFGNEEMREKALRSYPGTDMGAEDSMARASSLIREGERYFEIDSVKSLGKGDVRRAAIGWAVWTTISGIRQKWLAEVLGLNLGATASAQIGRFRSIPDAEMPTLVKSWKQKFERKERV